MANRQMIMRAFNVTELTQIEDALEDYIEHNGFCDQNLRVLQPLKEDVTFARRMLHQLGKSDHSDR